MIITDANEIQSVSSEVIGGTINEGTFIKHFPSVPTHSLIFLAQVLPTTTEVVPVYATDKHQSVSVEMKVNDAIKVQSVSQDALMSPIPTANPFVVQPFSIPSD